MTRRTILSLILVLLSAAYPSGPSAGTRSLKASFVRNGAAEISIAEDGLRVVRYQLNRLMRGSENPLKAFAGGPAIIIDVRNEGAEPRDFALAVALFDRQGVLVGIGSQSHTGDLDPGESDQLKLVLKDVNHGVPQAVTIIMTLETRR